MAVAAGRAFLVQPSSLTFASHNNLLNHSFGTTNTSLLVKPGNARGFARQMVRAQGRPTWLPGLDPPAYLDGRWVPPGTDRFGLIVFLLSFDTCSFSVGGLFLRFNSLAGDFGFDPLGLGEDPESLRWYVQAELVHCRFAMLGVAGILLTDVSKSKQLI